MSEAKPRCAYCPDTATTVDHVVPRALYPESKAGSRVQRITVNACHPCNKSWQDDEPHFRSMLLMAGEEATPTVRELWEGKTRRSFAQVDGRRRALDLFAQMVPIPDTAAGHQHMVYPCRDERVMRIVRKIVRGLCHHHQLPSPVPDNDVFADHYKYKIPAEFLPYMTVGHVEEDIFDYKYMVINDLGLHSGWLLRFFQRTPFFCIVSQPIAESN